MLWTTPESLHERLPLVSASTAVALTADARIDNREDLLKTFGLGESTGREMSDSELILRTYERWGERCPEKLLGDFAFVLWDAPRQVLFCARDHFGIKPFYYYYSPGRVFVCASEIKALFCLPEVPRRLNEVRVADYLASLVEDKAITFYQNIFRLPPACSLTIDRKGLRLREYWSPDPAREIRYKAEEEYAEAFREQFTEAVRCRLRSAYPVGSTLSGGLDSSSVTCVARNLLSETKRPLLHTFSAVFNETPICDERPFIEAVLVQGGVNPHYVYPDQLSVLAEIDKVLWQQDQPIYIRNMSFLRSLYKAAAAARVRVLLDGEDGDTVASQGDGRLGELARTGRWAEFAEETVALWRHFQRYHASPSYWLQTYGLPSLTELARTGRWIAFGQAVTALHRYFALSRRNLVWNHGLKPFVPQAVHRGWRVLRRNTRPPPADNFLLNPDFAKRIGFTERTATLLARYAPVRTLREEHWLSLTAGIHSCVQEEDDKAAAAFALEVRHPFWDRRVVEFCLALPSEQKLRQGWPRWVVRAAMTNILPEKICWRSDKSNLGPNFAHSLLVRERNRVETELLQTPEVIAAYVDIPALQKAYQRADANSIWPVLLLALWLRYAQLAP
jgi:asparagine synthase (glutamine-hydrolysing)